MLNNKKILALIPARAGSKGLPGKNKKPLCGKPLVAWTLEAAAGSRYIDRVIVSTDDEDIAKAAKEYGAQVPFIRPPELATDKAKAMDVILHAHNWLVGQREDYDIIIYLQPTSPLRTREDIDNALEFFFSKDAETVIGVCRSSKPGYYINRLSGDGKMSDFIANKDASKNRQDDGDFFRINGAVYISWVSHICSKKSWYGNKAFAYIMPEDRSVDIDTELDFQIAEFIMKKRLIRSEI